MYMLVFSDKQLCCWTTHTFINSCIAGLHTFINSCIAGLHTFIITYPYLLLTYDIDTLFFSMLHDDFRLT